MNRTVSFFILYLRNVQAASGFGLIWMVPQTTFLYISSGESLTHFCGAHTKCSISTSRGMHMFRFKGCWQTGFQGGCINLQVYQKYLIVLIVPHSCQNFFFFFLYRSLLFLWATWWGVGFLGQSVYGFLLWHKWPGCFSEKSVWLHIFPRNIKEYSSPYISTNHKYDCSLSFAILMGVKNTTLLF